MTEKINSRRTFFKKAAAAVGIVAAADYIRTLLSARPNSVNDATEKYASDVKAQEIIFSKKQLVLMTDNEKKQRLDELLSNYQKGSA